MARIEPRNFHRLALAVHDPIEAAEWFGRVLGASSIGGTRASGVQRADSGNMAGTTTHLLWVGGYPVILLSGGIVESFLERRGPGVQSFAWEVDDNWETEHLVRDRDIRVISVNRTGRFFFMHPADTHGMLLEWCDGKMPRESRPERPQGGVVDISELAWVGAVVADAEEAAAWMGTLMVTKPVDGNPVGPSEHERTVDVSVGDVTVRLVTPLSSESRYAPVLEHGPRVYSFGVRVRDLDSTLERLAGEGIGTTYRHGSLATTDPTATLGIPLEWTE